jgi:nucleoside 2-deoxyribosyltransferase
MKTKIYIAGPITGYDIEERKAKFQRHQLFLEDNGFEVINPMELPHKHDKTWTSYMKECIEALVKCDCIYMLKDFEISSEASLEFYLATQLSIKIFFEK